MAASKDMQMSYNLGTLLKEEKTFDIEAVRESCEMKAIAFISKSKAWNPFLRGKYGRDFSSETMIPKHIVEDKWQLGELKALKTRGDGNCLYRACSKLLCGKEDLYTVLRDLTSIELFNHQEFYAFHPYVKECSLLFQSENTAFSASTSDAALGDGYDRKDPSSRVAVVKREAIRNANSDTFSSFICVFALSSVTGMNIMSVYPEEVGKANKYSQFLNGNILPRIIHDSFSRSMDQPRKLILMWTSAGVHSIPGLDSSFRANHFVPLVECSAKKETKVKLPKQQRITDMFKSRGLEKKGASSSESPQVQDTSKQISVELLKKNANDGESKQQMTTTEVKPPAAQEVKNFVDELTDESLFAQRKCDPTRTTLKRQLTLKQERTSQNEGNEGCTKKIKADVSDVDSLDIGRFVSSTGINDDTKLALINNHWKPPPDFKFPISTSHRKFCSNWLIRWSWLCYSKLYDGAFCLSCVLFGHETGRNSSKLSILFKEPLTNWQSAATKLEEHNKNSMIHRDSMLRLVNFRGVMMGETKGIDEQADSMKSARIQYNRSILASITKTVILAGRQNLPLRGHRDDSQHYSSANPGNFQAFLNFRIDAGDTKLEKHFETAKKNATYRSKTIQNELAKICGDQIRENIVAEINRSGCPIYSVLGDEATDCGSKEQMSIVLRFVDSKKEINERFIKFVECEGMTGEALAKNIEDTLQEVGLPLANCRGQGYDGASAMSSQSKGVSGRILSKNPKALYVHCSSHRLNLVVAKACELTPVRNMLGHAQKISSFFSPSPQRMKLLREKMADVGLKRQKLAAPSTTRWVQRISTLDGFVEAFEAIFQSLEYMKVNANKEFTNSSSDADGFFRSIKSFEFIVSLVVTCNVLHHTLSLTTQLQRRKIDIAESLKQINLLKAQMKNLRESVDKIHDNYYDEALQLAENVSVKEKIPRLCSIQTARDNYPASTARDYYRLKLTIPLLDHLIEQIEFRFPSDMCNLYNGFYIIPGIFLHCKGVDWKTEFMKFVEAYRDDMPNYRAMHAELGLWETNWKGGFEKVKYDSVADTLRNCNEFAFPNIFTSLKILAVVPVTTCECERSVSALRRMKTWLRSTMTNERLNGLAQMHINDDVPINVEEVINTFARQNPTRMQFLDILQDIENEKQQ